MVITTLPASRFAAQLASLGPTTARTYQDPETVPLLARKISALPSKTKSRLLKDLVKAFDEENWNPGADFTQDEHDVSTYSRDGLRVAVQTTGLRWEEPSKARAGQWKIVFKGGVRAEAKCIDDLLRVVYTPDVIHILRPPSIPPTRQISIYSRSHIRGWRAAYDLFILPKMQSSGYEIVGTVDYSDPRLATLVQRSRTELGLTALAFDGVPLSEYSPPVRATRLVTLACAVEEEIEPGDSCVMVTKAQTGKQRQYSWKRGARRVLCRAAQLAWDKSSKRWNFQVRGVPLAHAAGVQGSPDRLSYAGYDELQFALYSPRGVYVFRHEGMGSVSGECTCRFMLDRQATKASATALSTPYEDEAEAVDREIFMLKVCGPRQEESWDAALHGSILPKLGCCGVIIAFVEWEHGDVPARLDDVVWTVE